MDSILNGKIAKEENNIIHVRLRVKESMLLVVKKKKHSKKWIWLCLKFVFFIFFLGGGS